MKKIVFFILTIFFAQTIIVSAQGNKFKIFKSAFKTKVKGTKQPTLFSEFFRDLPVADKAKINKTLQKVADIASKGKAQDNVNLGSAIDLVFKEIKDTGERKKFFDALDDIANNTAGFDKHQAELLIREFSRGDFPAHSNGAAGVIKVHAKKKLDDIEPVRDRNYTHALLPTDKKKGPDAVKGDTLIEVKSTANLKYLTESAANQFKKTLIRSVVDPKKAQRRLNLTEYGLLKDNLVKGKIKFTLLVDNRDGLKNTAENREAVFKAFIEKADDMLPKGTGPKSKKLKKELKDLFEDFFTSDKFDVEFIN